MQGGIPEKRESAAEKSRPMRKKGGQRDMEGFNMEKKPSLPTIRVVGVRYGPRRGPGQRNECPEGSRNAPGIPERNSGQKDAASRKKA